MLTAYYGRGCDSHTQFDGLEISKDVAFEEHINKYDVVYLDASRFFEESHREKGLTVSQSLIRFAKRLSDELMEEYTDISKGDATFTEYLTRVSA